MNNAEALKKILNSYSTDSQGHAVGARDRGTGFETLCRVFFENDSKFKHIFSEVLSFAEWVDKYGYRKGFKEAKDIGIDLVGVYRNREGCEAIQCKFFDPTAVISKEEINSFITASNTSAFTGRRIVSTTGHFGGNAKSTMEKVIPAVRVTSIYDLEHSDINWSDYAENKQVIKQAQKKPREEQLEVIHKAVTYLENGTLAHPQKGRVYMACGTGKTFTSLRIAEDVTPHKDSLVLFLAPSLHLVNQTLTEWTQQTRRSMNCFAVCSDEKTGKQTDDLGRIENNLDYPATTDAKTLADKVRQAQQDNPDSLTVIFSTYQSSSVIGQAQHENGLPPFAFVVCDEAHRTSGGVENDNPTTKEGKQKKAFQFIHKAPEDGGIERARTLFMTATPKVYSGEALEKSKDADMTLYSMDDEAIYGKIIAEISFNKAVQLKRLCPYKIVVMGVPEDEIREFVPEALRDKDNNLDLDTASRIIGSWKGLSRADMRGETSIEPMKRAMAFCSRIDPSSKSAGISSKVVAANFSDVIEEYRERHGDIGCGVEVEHIDGTFNAAEKSACLQWLRDGSEEIRDGEPVCRILSNVRCLSEGVDVPALDAVMFLSPRNSQVDVVQSVGRVMRTAPNKKLGYIIIPVVVPEWTTAEQYFTKNKDNPFKAVWTVLQAIRAHDKSLDEEMDRINLGGNPDLSRMEVVCVSDSLPRKQRKERASDKLNRKNVTDRQTKQRKRETTEKLRGELQRSLPFLADREKLEDALFSQIVRKVGNRNPFERWSKDTQRIVQRHIKSIEKLLESRVDDTPEQQQQTKNARAVFNKLKDEIHASINPNVPDIDIIDMLGQHMVTGRVFDALFGEEGSHSSNPITKALDQVMAVLYENGLAKENAKLENFYTSIRNRVKNQPPEVAKHLTVQLYDEFFRTAFKKQADKLGIVYTPLPIVDFILRSVENALQEHFGYGMGSDKVAVLDPFTGTGSFISRLIELTNEEGDHIIPDHALPGKYKSARKEDAQFGKPALWANEIVLLAYYIASVNIATSYRQRTRESVPFGGICLTDTFNLTENVQGVQKELGEGENYLKNNSDRIVAQETAPIKVIIGNPPYSIGARTAGEAQNDQYDRLNNRIEDTYAKYTASSNPKSLYDSYIKAYRWATDRIKDRGIIGFISNAGWMESPSCEGVRRCFEDEFSEVLVFSLRGNQRTKGEESKKEGGKIFGGGSRAPIAITLLIKTDKPKGQKARIRYCDIGDYLDANQDFVSEHSEKREAPQTDNFYWLKHFGSLQGIPEQAEDAGTQRNAEQGGNPEGIFRRWQDIHPDKHGDWLNQRDERFNNFMVLGSKETLNGIFRIFCLGLTTNRDAWLWNFSKKRVEETLQGQVQAYEAKRAELNKIVGENADRKAKLAKFNELGGLKTRTLSWTRALKNDVSANKPLTVKNGHMRIGTYRPFTKEWVFFSRRLNEYIYKLPKLFPMSETKNRVICVTGLSASNFSCIMMDNIPDLNSLQAGAQCFPLYWYEKQGEADRGTLFQKDGTYDESASSEYTRHDAITDVGLKHFQEAYGDMGRQISKEDLFYYIYGLLHSENYRKRYGNNLAKELPRIPRVGTLKAFKEFSDAGRKLAQLHTDYENVAPYYALNDTEHVHIRPTDSDEWTYRVEKMRFDKKRDPEAGKKVDDPTALIYNERIKVTGIPEEAYDYVVNGYPALRWVMERQQIKTDKRSEITNDPNTWANETMHDPKYPLELFLKVMTVSMETQKIVKNLPKLDILDN